MDPARGSLQDSISIFLCRHFLCPEESLLPSSVPGYVSFFKLFLLDSQKYTIIFGHVGKVKGKKLLFFLFLFFLVNVTVY
jgi:hypothetical protein